MKKLHQWSKKILFNRFNKPNSSESNYRGSGDSTVKNGINTIPEKEELRKELFDNDPAKLVVDNHSEQVNYSEVEESPFIDEEDENEEMGDELIFQNFIDNFVEEHASTHKEENIVDIDEQAKEVNQIEGDASDYPFYDESDEEPPLLFETEEVVEINNNSIYSSHDDRPDQVEDIEVEAEESPFYDDSNEEDYEFDEEEPDFQSFFQEYEDDTVSAAIMENSVEIEESKTSHNKRRSLSEEELEEEREYLKNTVKHVSRMPQKEWIIEFNQSEDPNHILWRRMINHGTDDQSAYYEEKRDKYLGERKTKLLNKPYSTAISIVKDDNFYKYYIGNRDIYTYKGENRENQIVYHEHSPIGERYLEFHGMPDKSLAEFEDILEVINFTIFNGEFGKDPDIEFSRINGQAAEDFDPLLNQIKANRNNNDAHDIFSTIRLTQTSIVKAPIDKPSLVNGCAGSGKTILMFYRISRAKYQAKYSSFKKPLKMENFALITPTDILRNYNDRIIQEREISGIRQITPHELIRDALEEYYFGSDTQISQKLELGFNNDKERIRDEYALDTAETIFQTVFSLLNDDNGILTNDIKNLNMKIRSFELNLSYRWKADFKFLIKLSESSFNDVKKQWMKITKTDLEKARKQLEKDICSAAKKLNYFDFLAKIGTDYEFGEQNSKTFEKEYQSLNVNELEGINKILDFIGKGYQEQNELLNENIYGEESDKTVIEFVKELNPQLLSLSHTQILWLLDLKKKTVKVLKELETEKSLIEILLKTEMLDEKPTNTKKSTNALKAVYKFYKRTGIEINNELTTEDFPGIKAFEQYFRMKELYKFLCTIRKSKKKDGNFNQLVCYAVRRLLAPEKAEEFPYKIETWSEAVHHIYIQQKLGIQLSQTVNYYKDRFNDDLYYLFFDEVQDLSLLEVKCIEGIYPHSISHYMGDPFQCINPKGLQTLEEFKKLNNKPELEYFDLDINYRNSKNVTEYVNEQLGMKMKPIGLPGEVQTIQSIKELRGKLHVQHNDGIAVIVKDKLNLSQEEETELAYLSEYKIYSNITLIKELTEPIPIVYSISDIKGLEFETVVVFPKELTRNELYLSCTRALNNLYVLKGNK